MKVYILESYWDYEGSVILSIHETPEGAKKALLEAVGDREVFKISYKQNSIHARNSVEGGGYTVEEHEVEE